MHSPTLATAIPAAMASGRLAHGALERPVHLLGKRERAGEPWRFDREEVDEPRHAMRLRALDDEIGGGRAARPDLRADAGVAGLDRAVLQPGIVAPDRLVEAVRPPRVDAVVDGLDPLDVRPEPDLIAEIDGHVDAKPGLLGDRVDEVPERPRAGERVVVALGEISLWDQGGIEALDLRRHRRGMEAGGIDEDARLQRHGGLAADLELDA